MKRVFAGLGLLVLAPVGIAAASYTLGGEPVCQELTGDIGTIPVEQERWVMLDPNGTSCDLRLAVFDIQKPNKGPLQPLLLGKPKYGSARIDGDKVVYSPPTRIEGEEVFAVTYKSALGMDLMATVALRPAQAP
jgi:hypothetical protein